MFHDLTVFAPTRMADYRFKGQSGWLFVLIFALLSCKGEPAWLTEVGSLLDKMNSDLEFIQAALKPRANRAQVIDGLIQLERAIEENGAETLRIFKSYPEVQTQSKLAEKKFLDKFRRLASNYKSVSELVEYWKKTFRRDQEIQVIIERISRKVKETNAQTQNF